MDKTDKIIANYNAAVDLDRQWWAQRILDTTEEDAFDSPVFSQGNETEPFRGNLGTRVKNVCANGVPAIQRVNAGPPTPP